MNNDATGRIKNSNIFLTFDLDAMMNPALEGNGPGDEFAEQHEHVMCVWIR